MSSRKERLGAEQYCYLTMTGGRTGQPHEIKVWFAAGDTIYLMNGGARRPPGTSDRVQP